MVPCNVTDCTQALGTRILRPVTNAETITDVYYIYTFIATAIDVTAVVQFQEGVSPKYNRGSYFVSLDYPQELDDKILLQKKAQTQNK